MTSGKHTAQARVYTATAHLRTCGDDSRRDRFESRNEPGARAKPRRPGKTWLLKRSVSLTAAECLCRSAVESHPAKVQPEAGSESCVMFATEAIDCVDEQVFPPLRLNLSIPDTVRSQRGHGARLEAEHPRCHRSISAAARPEHRQTLLSQSPLAARDGPGARFCLCY